MIIPFLALLVALGVLFGAQAMVVDLGYGMGEQGAMQNAADAGAMAAAKLMAGSVALDSSGNAVYVVSDNQVYQRALSLATPNFVGSLGSSAHAIAVQYLACPGQSDGRPNFAAQSDSTVVTDLVNAGVAPSGSTRLSAALANDLGIGSAPDWSWSSPICMVRVWSRESHNPLFAATFSSPPAARELAKATARIYPTTPPTDIGDTWPITHWLYNDTLCAFSPGSLCTFWSSNAAPGGNFKEVTDLSRYSQLAISAGIPTRPALLGQLTSAVWSNVLGNRSLYCPSTSTTPCWDPTYPGNNGKNVDVPNWITNGWHGHLYVNESDPNCTNPAVVLQSCQNSRVELYGGDMGSNIGTAMTNYINSHPDPGSPDPSCNCNSATIAVFFWRYGEQSINETCPSPPGSCSVDQGTIWGASTNPNKENANQLQRAILQKARLFRFNTQTVSSSSVQGYYVSFYSSNPPTAGPPSGVANTIGLVD
jgi:hypothetical protein